MRLSESVFETGVLCRLLSVLVAGQLIVVLGGCGGGGDSGGNDPESGSITWSLQGDPPTVVSITDGPWTLTQMAAGNPHPPSAPNQSYGYNAEFLSANDGQTSPMQPFYFPFILGRGMNLQGYFDWRPKDINEAIVAAHSTDGGLSWQFDQAAYVLTEALPINQQNANPDGGIADDGFGHPTVIRIPNPAPTPIQTPLPATKPTPTYVGRAVTYLYTLDRSAGAVDKFGLIVTPLSPTDDMPLNGAPSDIPRVGEFTDETKVIRTVGLKNPDGILGVVPGSFPVEVLYIQKIGNGDSSGSTALPPGDQCQTQPYAPPGDSSPFPANHDLVNVRLAITQDGINFSDLGVVAGLNDPTTTSYVGTRWIAPGGTILDLGNGRYGLFFAGGNCMDADSDAFHYIGYAETLNNFDLTSWTIINGINNPIVSTDSHTLPVDGVPTLIPAETPVAGPTLDAFDARAYSPSVTVFDSHTVTLTFGGYHIYTVKNDRFDYRTVSTLRLTASRAIPLNARDK